MGVLPIKVGFKKMDQYQLVLLQILIGVVAFVIGMGKGHNVEIRYLRGEKVK